MNNVSLQLQQYRALKAQATSASAGAETAVLERHPEKTDYFHRLMQRWQSSHVNAENAESV